MIFVGQFPVTHLCMVRSLYHFIHALLSFTAQGLCFCVLDYAFSNATAIQEFAPTSLNFPGM